MGYDFSGYATKNGLKCSDGRTIIGGAFKNNDGTTVPLVWQHQHNDPTNVLGHAILENRSDGVYAYCKLNDSDSGKQARELVSHGDITSLSIYANQLKQQGGNVIHGIIREVSLVLTGANPGALIDNVSIRHGDGDYDISESEAVIYTGLAISNEEIQHQETKSISVEESKETEETDVADEKEKTVKDVFDTLTDEQKNIVYYLIGQALENQEEELAQAYNDEGENVLMHHNVFEGEFVDETPSLTHDQITEIFADAKRGGSLKDSFLAHAATYGIENINVLFPDAKAMSNDPAFISRRMEWVADVMGNTRHTPFSRVKTILADVTAEEARARGYAKGTLKKEEIIKLLKRVTNPTTVYKKQKLDRDDMLDITDFDVVAWLKAEMRMMIDEEIARAVLVGDGRESYDEDKVKDPAGSTEGAGIRSIWLDDDMYAEKVDVSVGVEEVTPETTIDSIIRARSLYKGSGTPTLFTTTAILSDMLLLKDKMGRRLYNTSADLASALRVNKIVEVPIMDGLSRVDGADTFNLLGIIVNLTDYSLGSDRGGEVSMFDDFDIDYNQQKYLLETRLSGALTLPKSALVIEQKVLTTP